LEKKLFKKYCIRNKKCPTLQQYKGSLQ